MTFDKSEKYWAGKTHAESHKPDENRIYELFAGKFHFQINTKFKAGILKEYEINGPTVVH
jgi:hypothetical protein